MKSIIIFYFIICSFGTLVLCLYIYTDCNAIGSCMYVLKRCRLLLQKDFHLIIVYGQNWQTYSAIFLNYVVCCCIQSDLFISKKTNSHAILDWLKILSKTYFVNGCCSNFTHGLDSAQERPGNTTSRFGQNRQHTVLYRKYAKE